MIDFKRRAAARLLAAAVLALASATGHAADAWVPTATTALTPPAGTPISALPDDQPIMVTVSLKLRDKAALDRLVRNQYTPGNPQYGLYLTPSQFREQFAPTPAQVQAVAAYLKASGFDAIRVSRSGTLVGGRAPKAVVERAFDTRLVQVTLDGQSRYLNIEDAHVPASLGDIVLSINGLQSVVRMKTDLERAAERQGLVLAPYRRGVTPMTLTDPNQAFAVPSEQEFGPEAFQKAYGAAGTSEGSNTVLAISTYGDDLTQVIADLRAFEKEHGLPYVPVEVRQEAPIPAADVDTAGDGEWDLDSQYSTGMAGNVRKLVLYTANANGSASILWEYEDFASDESTDHPTVGNMSYGTCDVLWPVTQPLIFTFLPDMASADQQFEAAAAEGRSWHASSGDSGGACSPGNFQAAPDTGIPGGAMYPASSPYVTSVGGTSLFTDADGNYAEEAAWTSGGGGISYVEPAPAWQAGIVPSANGPNPLKGVPDLAMDAGLLLLSQCANVSGASAGCYLGTSLSSPLAAGTWARLQTARCNALGFAAPTYYALATTSAPFTATGFNDVLIGSNGFWSATPGWDYTTGFGSPDVGRLLAALPAGGCTPTTAAPTATLAARLDSARNTHVLFAASGRPNGDPIAWYVLDYGDDPANVQVQPASHPGFEHVYALPGAYTATLWARNTHGVVSQASQLIVNVPGTPAACTSPGFQLVSSPAGSAGTDGVDVGQGADDLLATYFSEPPALDNKLVITMKVADLSSVPPGFRWVTYFNIPEDANQYFVAMDTANGPTPAFIYGTHGTLPGAGVGTYTVLGSLDAASNYTADGTITLVLDLAALSLRPGDVLTAIETTTRTTAPEDPSGAAPGGEGLTQDAATAIANYAIVGNSTCRAGGGGNGGIQTPPRDGAAAAGGGAFGFALLLPLFGAALARRRRGIRFAR